MREIEMYEVSMPNLPYCLRLFDGEMAQASQKIFELCCEYSNLEQIKALKLEFPEDFPAQQYMGAMPIVQKFQSFLIGLSGARNILEIGTFIGASTMNLAQSVGLNGHVWSIEKYDVFASLAKKNFAANGIDNITLLEGDAQEILPSLCKDREFDFIFLDGNKEKYASYFVLLWDHLKKGGVIMLDDALFCGDLLNPEPKTNKGKGVYSLLQTIKAYCAGGG